MNKIFLAIPFVLLGCGSSDFLGKPYAEIKAHVVAGGEAAKPEFKKGLTVAGQIVSDYVEHIINKHF